MPGEVAEGRSGDSANGWASLAKDTATITAEGQIAAVELPEGPPFGGPSLSLDPEAGIEPASVMRDNQIPCGVESESGALEIWIEPDGSVTADSPRPGWIEFAQISYQAAEAPERPGAAKRAPPLVLGLCLVLAGGSLIGLGQAVTPWGYIAVVIGVVTLLAGFAVAAS